MFVDAATAWTQDSVLDLVESGGPIGFYLRDLQMAYGFGVRAYIGLPLRFDAAMPTDLRRNGQWFTTFSVGFDF